MAELIIALDISSGHKAVEMAESLRGAAGWLKVGLELFVAAGPELMRKLKDMGFRIFLDLKFYDIPHTVSRAVAAACALEVDMLTLHCQGGARMCEAARSAAHALAGGASPKLFGVTALTSFGPGEMPGITGEPGEFGLELAMAARNWGLDGVVCSGREVAEIKKNTSGLLCLCPGIRPLGQGSHDQRRTMTPGEAVAAGADFLVVGRPVLEASDPVAAAEEILRQMGNLN